MSFAAPPLPWLKARSASPGPPGLKGRNRRPSLQAGPKREKGNTSLEHIGLPAADPSLLETGGEPPHCRAPEPHWLSRGPSGLVRPNPAALRQSRRPGRRPRGRALCPCSQLQPDAGCPSLRRIAHRRFGGPSGPKSAGRSPNHPPLRGTGRSLGRRTGRSPSRSPNRPPLRGAAGCRNTLVGASTSVRARLQSCRKCRRIIVGFSPCGMLLVGSNRPVPFFSSHSSRSPDRRTGRGPSRSPDR